MICLYYFNHIERSIRVDDTFTKKINKKIEYFRIEIANTDNYDKIKKYTKYIFKYKNLIKHNKDKKNNYNYKQVIFNLLLSVFGDVPLVYLTVKIHNDDCNGSITILSIVTSIFTIFLSIGNLIDHYQKRDYIYKI